MTRKIKALGLAFVAVAAMSMVAAGGAQASELHAATVGANTVLTGEQYAGGQQNTFRITAPNGVPVVCTQAHLDTVGLQISSNALPKTTQHGTLTGQYTGCTLAGQPATIKMNGCRYTLTGAGQPANTAKVDVVGCTAGKQIVINAAGLCEIRVPEQATGGHITFAQTVQDVTATIRLTGIAYQVTGPLCGHTNNVTTVDGEYQGTVTVRAFEDNGTVNKQHEGHTALIRSSTGNPVALTTT
jgi:hypothetical protein